MRVTDEQAMCDKSNFPDMSDLYKYAADLLEARELIKEMREELREVLISREHGEAKEMVFIANFTEIESILERTKEYQ